MNIKIIVVVILIGLTLYLQQSYARIYNRNVTDIVDLVWPNSITMKNPSFQNTVKYVALGDSLTVGTGSKEIIKTLPYIIESKISSQMSVSLTNLAVAGSTSNDVASNQLNKAILLKPNYVTLLIGTNDIHALIPASKFKEQMTEIIGSLTKNTVAKIIVFNIPYLGSKDLILFPYNLLLDYQVQQYNKIITNICADYKLTLIDLYQPTMNQFSKQANFYSSDNFHPSADGYQMWGSLVTLKDL